MILTLNETEQKLAVYLAKQRHAKARAKGITDKQIGPQDSHETDLQGIGAEIAFCRLLNVYPDTDTGHTPDHDCVLPSGQTVDVKATKHPNGHLLVARWKSPAAVQTYALMVGAFPSYRLAGFMPSAELFKDERLKNFGHGEGYAAAQNELRFADQGHRPFPHDMRAAFGVNAEVSDAHPAADVGKHENRERGERSLR
jgi:hypothetical protein